MKKCPYLSDTKNIDKVEKSIHAKKLYNSTEKSVLVSMPTSYIFENFASKIPTFCSFL